MSPGSLRGRLALMAAASILPMLLLYGAEGYAAYRAERTRAGQRQLEVARSMAATVERELGGAIASLNALALSPRLQQGDLPGFRTLAMRYIVSQPDGSALILLDSSGQQLVNTLVAAGAALPRRDPGVTEVLTRRVFETARPMVSNVFHRALGGALIVTADVPVLRGGQVVYDLSLVLPASRFTGIIAEQHLAPGTVSSIYDRAGVHVARVPGTERFSGVPAPARLLPHLLAETEGIIASTAMEGTPLLTAFSRASMSGWSVTVGVPEAVLARRLRSSLLLLLGAGLMGLACSLAVATVLAERVIGPMRALARLAADPRQPDDDRLHSLSEVDEVAAALRHSLAGRQAALEALQRLNGDLEQRVRHEIRNREHAQAQLAQSQRMEALGQLAGGIAHDFNNVLQAVTGGLSLIQRRAADPDAVRRLAGMASDAAERGAAITGRLLTFARRGDLVAAPIEPVALLESLREMLAHTLGVAVSVVVEALPGLPRFMADRAQLETVLVNLAVNARDAMPHGGTLSLSADTDDVGPGDLDRSGGLRPGCYVRLVLTDTGVGMDAATLARASEPFFTTKPPGQGTGLGLAMARGFAEQSGGTLRIHSAPGSGTTITLWFPCARPDISDPRHGAAGPPDKALAPQRLLMVDDDSMVREMLAHELEDRGFLVTTASDGLSALALLDGGQPADLLVSDYAMPGMNGVTLMQEARRRLPNLPVLLLTGYAEAETGVSVAGDRLTGVLRKPVSGAELAAHATALCQAGPREA